VDGTRSPRQHVACWAVFPQSETPEYTCLPRKPVALINRQGGACVITPLAAHSDDATHPPLTLPGSVQPLAVGPAAAADNPWLTLGVCASDDSSGSIRSGAASNVAHPGRSRGPGIRDQDSAAPIGYGGDALWAWSSGTGRTAVRAHLSVSRTGQANPWPAEMLLVHTAPRASQLLARSPRQEDGCPPDQWNRRHC
jgi:hypothetical protein